MLMLIINMIDIIDDMRVAPLAIVMLMMMVKMKMNMDIVNNDNGANNDENDNVANEC